VAQQYLPAGVQGSIFYKPSDQGYEKQILERLQQWRQTQAEGLKRAAEKNANNPPDPARK
jgi:putative ATPase